jgi:hypothetical protein
MSDPTHRAPNARWPSNHGPICAATQGPPRYRWHHSLQTRNNHLGNDSQASSVSRCVCIDLTKSGGTILPDGARIGADQTGKCVSSGKRGMMCQCTCGMAVPRLATLILAGVLVARVGGAVFAHFAFRMDDMSPEAFSTIRNDSSRARSGLPSMMAFIRSRCSATARGRCDPREAMVNISFSAMLKS